MKTILTACGALGFALMGAAHGAEEVSVSASAYAGKDAGTAELYGAIVEAADRVCASSDHSLAAAKGRTNARKDFLAERSHRSCVRLVVKRTLDRTDSAALSTYHASLSGSERRQLVSNAMAARTATTNYAAAE